MNFIINHLYTIYLPLLIILLAIITYNFRTHSKTKKLSQKKLAMVYNELEIEQKLSNSYKNNDTIIQSFKNKTQSKFLKIKVDLINIDFTYKEICRFI
mgnify:CR=1 FL=1